MLEVEVALLKGPKGSAGLSDLGTLLVGVLDDTTSELDGCFKPMVNAPVSTLVTSTRLDVERTVVGDVGTTSMIGVKEMPNVGGLLAAEELVLSCFSGVLALELEVDIPEVLESLFETIVPGILAMVDVCSSTDGVDTEATVSDDVRTLAGSGDTVATIVVLN